MRRILQLWQNMQLQSRQSLGYTLIEILVAIGIISLIFSFGYAGLREFSQRQVLISAGRSLRNDLRLAQSKAISGEKPTGCSVLDGYRVKVSSNTYSILAVCAKVEMSVNKDNIEIPEGITASTKSITFKALGEGTDLPKGSILTITLAQTATGRTLDIVVTSGGEIK